MGESGWVSMKSFRARVAGAAVLIGAMACFTLQSDTAAACEGHGAMVTVRAPRTRAVAPSPALLVVHHGAAFAVLSAKAKSTWSTARATVVPHSRYHVLLQDSQVQGLPRELGKWTSRSIDLFRGSRLVCRATVNGLAVLTRMYRGLIDPPKSGRSTPAEILRKARLVGAQRLLVGKLTPTGGVSCAGATWARAAQPGRAAVFSPVRRVPAELRKQALTEFRKLAAYRQVQREYLKQVKAPTERHWEAYRNSQLRVARYRTSGSRRSVIVVSASAGEGCGEFYGAHWAAWEVVARGAREKLVLLTPDRPTGESFVPDTIVAGPGSIELLGGNVLFRATGTALKRQSAVVPSYLCSC